MEQNLAAHYYERPAISMRDVLYYEVSSSWWARYISNEKLRAWAGSYYAWKVKRKHARYMHAMGFGKQLYIKKQELKLGN